MDRDGTHQVGYIFLSPFQDGTAVFFRYVNSSDCTQIFQLILELTFHLNHLTSYGPVDERGHWKQPLPDKQATTISVADFLMISKSNSLKFFVAIR